MKLKKKICDAIKKERLFTSKHFDLLLQLTHLQRNIFYFEGIWFLICITHFTVSVQLLSSLLVFAGKHKNYWQPRQPATDQIDCKEVVSVYFFVTSFSLGTDSNYLHCRIYTFPFQLVVGLFIWLGSNHVYSHLLSHQGVVLTSIYRGFCPAPVRAREGFWNLCFVLDFKGNYLNI